MVKHRNLLRLRKQWFKLQAKNFVSRYAAGLMVIAIFLPGVAIGDNLQLLMGAVTTPFLALIHQNTTWHLLIMHMLLLIAVFVVWARAQQHAINGGPFMLHLITQPVDEKVHRQHHFIMLWIGNHLLWPIVVYAGYLLFKTDAYLSIHALLRYLSLMLLLLQWQYVGLFARYRLSVIMASVFTLAFLGFLPDSIWGSIPLLVSLIAHLYVLIHKTHYFRAMHKGPSRAWLPRGLNQHLHVLMMFKSNRTATLFRLMFVMLLMAIFFLSTAHFLNISEGQLMPYMMVLEAFLAYYISGFYVMFSDERQHMKHTLLSLPVPWGFWVHKDITVLLVISSLIHLPFLWWQSQHASTKDLSLSLLFHLCLLIIGYPLRRLKSDHQTLITFAILFILTVLSIYFLL